MVIAFFITLLFLEWNYYIVVQGGTNDMKNDEKELLNELDRAEEDEEYEEDYQEEDKGYFFPDFRNFLN